MHEDDPSAPPPESPKFTVPPGVDEVPALVSATVAVQVEVVPIVTEDGEQLSVVAVDRTVPVTVLVSGPLVACVVEPA